MEEEGGEGEMFYRFVSGKRKLVKRRGKVRSKLKRRGDEPSKVIWFFPLLESTDELMADQFAKFNPIKPLRLLRKSDTILRIMVLLCYVCYSLSEVCRCRTFLLRV